MTRKLRVYFSCALTGLPKSHRKAMVALRDKFKERYEILEFCEPDTPPHDLYRHDIHFCVPTADFLICICDKRSIGLGWEMATAVEKYGKPVIAFAHKDAQVTSVVMGVDHPEFEFVRYEKVSEIEGLVYSFVEKHLAMPE